MPSPNDLRYAVTILQPWVDLILAGRKTYEFRPWRPRKFKEGDRFAIHEAGRGIVAIATFSYVAESLWHWNINGIFDQPGAPSRREFNAALEDPKKRPILAWRLAHVTPLLPIVTCMGSQGVWKVPDELLPQIEQRLEVAESLGGQPK